MQSLSETEKKRRGTKRRSSMTIKEVEQRLKITRANVRFYEKEGLIFPKRNPLNDYRDYSEEDVKSLSKIIFLREIGIPIADIRSLISEKWESMKSCADKRRCFSPNSRRQRMRSFC